jgi:membrane protein
MYTARKGLRGFWQAIKETWSRFRQVDPFTEAGSLAYTTIFAVPGVIILTLTVASIFYDPAAVREALYTQAGHLIGTSTARDLEAVVQKASTQRSTLFARIIAIVALVVSASAAFAALQGSLNKIWRVQVKPERAILRYLFTRVISLGMIAAFGFLLLISLVLDAALVAIGERLGAWLPGSAWFVGAAGLILSFAMVTVIFATVFIFLPDAKVPWRSVRVGALFTALLFSAGKYLIGLYIAKTNAGNAYGAGGAVIIILLWVYYSSVLVLFGAQFTEVSARTHDNRVEPSPQAVKLPDPEEEPHPRSAA